MSNGSGLNIDGNRWNVYCWQNQSMNEIKIFNVSRITQSPQKRSQHVDSYSKMSENDCWNQYVFSSLKKSITEADD